VAPVQPPLVSAREEYGATSGGWRDDLRHYDGTFGSTWTSFLAVFTLSYAARPLTLILKNKGKNEGEEASVKSQKNCAFKYFQPILWMVKLFG